MCVVCDAFPWIAAACFSLPERHTETGRRKRSVCPSVLWPSARRAPTKRERERVRARERMGQIFPWQDPRDAAEGRVQPVKERLRARQSISGLHLHNKWSSRGFSSACTRRHAHRSSTQCTPRRGRRDRERRRERRKGKALCWSGTPWQNRQEHPRLYCWMRQRRSHRLIRFGTSAAAFRGERSPTNEKVNQEPEGLPRCLSLMLKLWKIGV